MTAPLSDERLAKIRQREQKATKGPWAVGNDEVIGLGIEQTSRGSFTYEALLARVLDLFDREDENVGRRHLGSQHADAQFIAHAREDVPDLLAMVEHLRAGDHLAPEEVAIRAELARQDAKWGQQDHPDYDPRDIESVLLNEYAFRARRWKEINAERAQPTITRGRCFPEGAEPHTHTAWDGVLLEEVYEALSETDPQAMKAELLQVAAVAIQWCRAIDRRTANTSTSTENTPND